MNPIGEAIAEMVVGTIICAFLCGMGLIGGIWAIVHFLF